MTNGTAAATRGSSRVAVQKLGTALSNMVLPNIGAFIAWGLITALFIETGWVVLIGDAFGYGGGYGFVEHLGAWGAGAEGTGIVGPMITYLLPILIGYTGGRMMYDNTVRGGVVGAIATMGAVGGAEVPMFLGAMVMGPLGGWSMKKLDGLWQKRIRPGFEMLVNNFTAGIWGMILAIVGFVVAGPVVGAFSNVAGRVVDFLVTNSLLPLTSIFVEPAKVLFLNNAINHGVFTPLGITESQADGQSILFLIEANPGPGLGLLLAFTIFGSGAARASAPGAALIQFVGGIHEIYFPYVLMKPRLIIAMILGGMAGVATNLVFGSGLRAPAAPGSIIAVLVQAPVGSLIGVTLSVIIAAAVTFAVAGLLLKFDRSGTGDLASATASMEQMKGKKSSVAGMLSAKEAGPIKSIVFACDAGMGSSAMGASILRKKVQAAGFPDVSVTNVAISHMSDNVDLVVTHQNLTDRARQRTPSAIHVSVDDFMMTPRYDEVVELLQNQQGAPISEDVSATDTTGLDIESIVLTGAATTRDDAIREAGNLLVNSGAVSPDYVESMLEREASVSTFMGNGLAIPHGTLEAKASIHHTAMSVVRYPQGVTWEDGKQAEFVIGIAAAGDDHLQMLAKIADIFMDSTRVDRLRAATTAAEIRDVLSGVAV